MSAIAEPISTPKPKSLTRFLPVLAGKIKWVQLDQGADDYDHLTSPEERWHVAMTRQ
jgi:hypothetical protein